MGDNAKKRFFVFVYPQESRLRDNVFGYDHLVRKTLRWDSTTETLSVTSVCSFWVWVSKVVKTISSYK